MYLYFVFCSWHNIIPFVRFVILFFCSTLLFHVRAFCSTLFYSVLLCCSFTAVVLTSFLRFCFGFGFFVASSVYNFTAAAAAVSITYIRSPRSPCFFFPSHPYKNIYIPGIYYLYIRRPDPLWVPYRTIDRTARFDATESKLKPLGWEMMSIRDSILIANSSNGTTARGWDANPPVAVVHVGHNHRIASGRPCELPRGHVPPSSPGCYEYSTLSCLSADVVTPYLPKGCWRVFFLRAPPHVLICLRGYIPGARHFRIYVVLLVSAEGTMTGAGGNTTVNFVSI